MLRPAPLFPGLLDLPDNPCPPGGAWEPVRAADGVMLRCAHWPATASPPRGTVCVFPGRSEFIEKYYEVVGDLRARGFAVAMLDWRGQGGSQRLARDRRLGHVPRFSDYALDLEAFMRRIALPECPAPFYALAHSMGAACLFLALGQRPAWFERMVAIAPMIAILGRPPAATLLAEGFCGLGLGQRIVPGWSPNPIALKPFAGNPVTSDPVRYARAASVAAAEPGLAIGAPTVAWVRAALRLTRLFADPVFAREWRLPTLFLLGGEDRVVSTPAAEAFARRLRASAAIVVPGARHELLQERDDLRNRTWAAFDAFVPGAG